MIYKSCRVRQDITLTFWTTYYDGCLAYNIRHSNGCVERLNERQFTRKYEIYRVSASRAS